MELDYDWSIPVGYLGKGLKKRLPEATWKALETTYANASIEENWKALFNALDLFRDAGERVAASLGFEFPNELHRRVILFLQEYRAKGTALFRK